LELLQPLAATAAAMATDPMKLISLICIRPRRLTCPGGLDFVQTFRLFLRPAPQRGVAHGFSQ
jgi:hypothetical protein